MTDNVKIWKAKFERERAARLEAEKILQNRAAELVESNESMIQEYQSLEDLVSERTIALQEAVNTLQQEIQHRKVIEGKLLKAKNAAEEKVKLKSEFLARISHDIRTPLNSIFGYTNLLKQKKSEEKKSEYLKSIENSTRIMLRVVNDLLDLSKVEANKLVLNFDHHDVNAIFHETVNLIKPFASDKKIKLNLDMPSEFPESLFVEKNRFQQILTNLLSNAVKFTDAGSVTISVEVKRSIKKESYNSIFKPLDAAKDLKFLNLIIRISDTGIGIPEEDLENIFDVFSQSKDNYLKRNDVGSGLGLAICKKMVNLLGGEIEVKSKLAKGSTFTFNVPCGISPKDSSVKVETSEPEEIDNIATKMPLSILIADDYETNRLLLDEQLKTLGYTSDAVTNGDEVLRSLKIRDYDVILMDIRMPVLDGIQTTRRIRSNEHQKQPYIVAVTASAIKGDRDYFIKEGLNDYISKPIFMKKLSETLTKAYKHKKQNAADDTQIITNSFITKNNDEIVLDDLQSVIGSSADKIVMKVIPVFIRELPARQKKIIAYFKSNDVEKFREVCHGLKGSSKSVGANQLGDLCEKFEELAQNGILPDKKDVSKLITKSNQTKLALDNKLEVLNQLYG